MSDDIIYHMHMMNMSDGKISVGRGSTEAGKEFCEKFEASLAPGDVADHEPQEGYNLGIKHPCKWTILNKYLKHGRDGCEDSTLQPHREIKSSCQILVNGAV